MSGKGQHVVPSTQGGWAVRRTGAERASKVFLTLEGAVRYARSLAKKHGSELYVHGKDGMIRERSSFGVDPIP